MTRIIFAIAIAFAIIAPATVFADPSAADLEKAKKEFGLGKKAFDSGDFPEAASHFKTSYNLSKKPALLYNVALSNESGGQDDIALFYYRKFLTDAPADAPQRAEVTDRVKALEKKFGGKAWRKVESAALTAAGASEFTYVTDVQASPRDVNTLFATLNDWNRGNFKPYVLKSADRGKTWTSISGDLPARSGAWSIVQDAVNPNLMFIGMEFGLYATLDGGGHWIKMTGVPTSQVRDIAIHKREGDLVAGTFGRGVFILDDYTPLRDVTPQTLGEPARLYPMRDAYQYNELGQFEATWGNTTYQNPPYGALITYSIGPGPAPDAKTAIQIADDQGKQVRRIELTGDALTPGLHRVAWDLRGEPPAGAAPATGRGGGFGGRGNLGPTVPQARYTATIGTLSGETFTAIGKPIQFLVAALPR